MKPLPGSDAHSIPTFGARVCAKTQCLLRGLVLALTVAAPGGTLMAVNPNPVPVNLGTAKNFGALAGAAISGTGNVKGDVGSGSGAIAPAITSTGTLYPTGDAAVMTALTDWATAYAEAKGRTPDVVLNAAAYELGGQTLTRGIYQIGAAATLGSPVTLDAQGDPDAVFIIQIGAAFSATASVGNVILANNAQSAKVFWIVEGAVSMGASINMEGNILGNAAVTFGASTTVNGRLLAGAAAGTIAMATAINVPVDPSVVGDRIWFDANVNGIQDPSETTGFANIPVSLMQLVLEKKTLELGTTAHFGALAGAAISGSANVTGNVGSGTGAIAPAVTSPAGIVYATGHAAVMTALADFATAYNEGKNRTPDVLLSAAAHELGGSTLTPGVYQIGAAATLASTLTLDAQGDAEAVFIIQIVGAFGTTAATGNVVLANEAKSANVYWIVEGAVSLGAGTQMEGNILGGAAITFGATTHISGRAMAGTAAGTIALATTVSAVTGTPPVGFPDPIVVANTVTDASGNYLFEGVQPGTLFVRWDLTDFTTDYRVTDPKQGDNDELDSDSASGDVGGYVNSTEFVVLGGTTHLGVDLGLAETLPAVKAAARAELTATRQAYLLANPYTSENWTALLNAKTDGDTAINAATDPAGVAEAKATALAAMAAVPTVPDTLAEAKVAAKADLTTALAAYQEANYTAENWATLTIAKTNGDAAIQSAVNLVGVATARSAALAAMDAVPTVAGTLAVVKVAALNDLALVVATYLQSNYTAENWTAVQAANVNGQIAINAATNLAGVLTATNAALATLDAVPTFTESMATARAAALNALTTALATYLEANYYTFENWTALIAARAAGSAAINAATDPAGVETAATAALAAMATVPTITETLAMAKVAALNDFALVAATYLEASYTPGNWTALQTAIANGQIAIQAATNLAGLATATNAALASLDAVPVINETMATARAAALNALTTAFVTHLDANYYTSENLIALIAARTAGSAAINAAIDPAGVETAANATLAAMAAVPTVTETLTVAKAAALNDFELVVATYLEASYTSENWMALQTAMANGRIAIQAATNLAGVASATNQALAAMDAVPVIDEAMATARATALNALTTAFATYLETNTYTAENLLALTAARAAGSAAINTATDPAGVETAATAALAAMAAVLTIPEALAEAKVAALNDLALVAATYMEASYTPGNWTALQTAIANGQAAIQAATNLAGVASATNAALATMDAVPVIDEAMATARAAALNALTTAFAIHLETNYYTAENLLALTAARAAGSAAINTATDPAGVATAANTALAAMAAVPTISWTLAVAKVAALNDLALVVATYLEANYTAENWTALQTAIANGQAAINAATNLAGLASATNAALAAMDAVPVINETMATARAAALNALTTAFTTYLETNTYTSENLLALIAARAAGSASINEATDAAGVTTARDESLAAMDAVPTYIESLATAKVAALANLAAVAATYQEANYTSESWTALTLAQTNGQIAINAATDLAGVATATNTALAAMDAVPTIAEETLAAVKAAALANLGALAATYEEVNFTPAEWAALQLALANAEAAINAATNAASVALATSAALAALDVGPTNAETLAAAKVAALASLAAVAATYQEANFTPEQWAALQLALANAQAAIHAATNLTGVANATNTALAAIAETLAAVKAIALANLAALAATYLEANFTPEEWAALQLALANAQAAINAATTPAGVALATSAALAALDAVPMSAETLAAAIAAALANLAAVAATYQEANFTPEQWAALQLALANAQAAIIAATHLAGVATATNTGVTTLAIIAAATPTLTLVTPATGTTAGGTLVTLTGTNFTDATAVTFADIPASFTVNSATQITATTPAQAAGTVSVTVTNPSGSHVANNLFTYLTPTILVIGNGISIDNGETSPSLEDLTDFGSVRLLNGQVTRTFTFQNNGTAAFVLTGNPAVQILGADAADFKVTAQSSSSIAVGQSTTFAITFDPRLPGLRTATVSLASDDPDFNPITFAVSGFGTLDRLLAQKIVFTAPATHYLGQGPLMLTAEASSGLPVMLQILGPGTLAGSILTPTGVGKVTVRATQVGGGNYAAAKIVTRVITVKADPTVLTLTGLSQRYDGTPKSIGSVGTASPMTVSYKVAGFFGTTPPTAAGRYAVLAVAGGVTKKGTLVITKAPLYVVPQDRRKFAGELNPLLDLVYEGFVGNDTPAVLTRVPTLSTSAKVSSPGGTYPITAKSGLAANYTLIYRQGMLVVESFAARYETLLADAGSLPSGKLSLTVAKSGKSFSGSIAQAGVTSALRLKGTLMTNSLTERAEGAASVVSRGVAYVVSFTLTMQGELTGSLTQNSQPLATFLDGQRLLLLPSGAKVNSSGTYTGVLEPAQPQGPGVPAGAGWARAKVSTRGAIALVGKLGDGTAFTTTVLPSQQEMPSYRLWVQPYKPTRVETFLSGTFELQPNAFNSRLFVVADTSLIWAKAARAADKSYPAGFVRLTVGFTLDHWVKPTANQPLSGLLGLTADALVVAHSQTGSASDVHLPTTLTLSSRNVIGVAGLSNLTKWKTKLKTTTGTFTGSFELMDGGVKRVAKFSGVLRQPAGHQVELIGDGHFVIPTTPGGVETVSGEVLFRLP